MENDNTCRTRHYLVSIASMPYEEALGELVGVNDRQRLIFRRSRCYIDYDSQKGYPPVKEILERLANVASSRQHLYVAAVSTRGEDVRMVS